MVAFASDALSKLCSRDQLALLDSIDRLRMQGISNYVSLPQIIVCGDQSSGKSSVLEALSGVSFPIKSNLCTRFPTEVVLRRTSHFSASVSIIPHESRTESEREALRGFRQELAGFDDLPALVENAKAAMGINPHGKAFSKDILRIEITGPDRPHLTIVDLPGLIHSGTKNQTNSDVELIKTVVQSYMEQRRCIILAVVSAKNDFANQVVLSLARNIDKSGNRTLGVITKPDMLHPGSESEALYLSLARNQEVEFRHGWHVLRNMDSEKDAGSLTERDAKETEFFSSGVWTGLPLSRLGIEKLRERLSRLLLSHIASELPSLMQEIETKYKSCDRQLVHLGESRVSLEEQRRYLLQLSQSFQELVKASVGGNYTNTFFQDARTKTGYQQRIRAIIQNLNEDFASEISRRGHYRQIADQEQEDITSSESRGIIKISRERFILHIKDLQKRTRGRELPGTFNPMIVADLFLEQSKPWEGIVRQHVQNVWDAASRFIKLVVAHTADTSAAKALHVEVVEPAMQGILKEMRDKTTDLLKPHQHSHPITYNHYFTETLQNVRRERQQMQVEDILKLWFKVDSLGHAFYLNGDYDLRDLAVSLTSGGNEPDMKTFAANEALDCLNAYYKVALKRFIDDVAVEVIETKLLCALDGILSPLSVYQMDADQVARIAGESEEAKAEREQLTKQLEILGKGLTTCKNFAGLRIAGDSAFVSVKDPDPTPSQVDGIDDDSPIRTPVAGSQDPELASVHSFNSSPAPPLSPAPEPIVAELVCEEEPRMEEPDSYGFSSRVDKKKKKKKGRIAPWDDSWPNNPELEPEPVPVPEE